MRVHLVIPCYQESARIGLFLPELCQLMDGLDGVDVLVVEDGSGDVEQRRILQLIEGLQKDYRCLRAPLLLSQNLGKGGAVYAGWEAAAMEAECLAFVDADGASPADEVARLIQMMRAQVGRPHALFASRVKMLGKRVDRLLKRHLLGRVYATLVSELLDVPVYDSQCGLKLIPRSAYQSVAPHLQVKRFAFDVELMVALLDSGCDIEEVPIDWCEIPGGKIRLFRDSWRMAKDVWGIRKRRTQPKR